MMYENDVCLCDRRIINTQSFLFKFYDFQNLKIFVIGNPFAFELLLFQLNRYK